MRRRLEEARVVALPVLDNSYSGATTVLLQAMALAKPVVVTRTKAIASGYGLVDGENCRLVEPGDARRSSARSARCPPRRVARALRSARERARTVEGELDVGRATSTGSRGCSATHATPRVEIGRSQAA